MAAAFPDADLHSLTWNRAAGLSFGGRSVRTTFLDWPGIPDRRTLQLPLMPLAWRWASRRRYDVVVTSSHACAKGFWPARQALHLCYCYTPMRYVWLSSVDRRQSRHLLTSPAERALRAWDLRSVDWVDEFAAISTTVQDRIQRLYRRPARVLHPPVATEFFTPGPGPGKDGYALAVSRMVPYKRLDLAVQACHRAGRPLVIAGAGPGEGALRALVASLGADVRFVVNPNDEALRNLYRGADLLIFPAEEDFGIVAVEAQACGIPVIAYGCGGAVDTVAPGVTGVLVAEQTAEAFAAGLVELAAQSFDPEVCRRNAERFSSARFTDAFTGWVIESAAARGIAVDDPRAREAA